MKEKTSADYQREFRRRLREKGLVKKEVWILPEHAQALSVVEKQLRISGDVPRVGLDSAEENAMSEAVQWTSLNLCEALKKENLFKSGSASIELIDGMEPTLYIAMHDYGDLPIYLNVAGDQIIAESVLWASNDVADLAGFNDAVLRTHKYFPLSTICLEPGPNGQDYYMMFGALSSTSIIANVVYELEALASNVIQATTAYAEFLKLVKEA